METAATLVPVGPARPAVPAIAWPALPYKGLNFYTPQDSVLFCERADDIDGCGSLLAHFNTRLLVLHGRTGAGKSSFVRAGLFPEFLADERNFFYLCHRDRSDPLLIRSTADPIAAISGALRLKLQMPSELDVVGAPTKAKALECLTWSEPPAPPERADRLGDALQILTSRISGTFILAVDQAEEIFTLEKSNDEGLNRAYFGFLENLCFRPIDLKVILVVRTEYYGQFADGFTLQPETAVTPIRSGLAQFMLHGIRDPDSLRQIIEWPTSRKPPWQGAEAPFDHYGFDYAPGLAKTIAQEVVKHCGESSTLPVLQLVCFDLHQHAIVEKKTALISQEDYVLRGRVEGAIERFIAGAISTALGRTPGVATTTRACSDWQKVLTSLVGRQEGGALTSLLLPERDLREQASALGLHKPDDVLRAMSREETRLLRSALVRDAGTLDTTLHFSLGHDCLAPALYRSKESQRVVEDEQRRLRRWRRFAVVAAGLFLLAGGYLYQTTVARQLYVGSSLVYADGETRARTKLNTLLQAREQMSVVDRILGLNKPIDAALKGVLARSPTLSLEAATAGFGLKGRGVVWYNAQSRKIMGLESGGGGDPTTYGSHAQDPDAAPFPLAVGFVDKLAHPVLYQGRTIFWHEGNEEKRLALGDLDATTKDGSWIMPEFAGGLLRLTRFVPSASASPAPAPAKRDGIRMRSPSPTAVQDSGGRSRIQFIDLRYDPAGHTFVLDTSPSPVHQTIAFSPPAYDDDSDLFAEVKASDNALILHIRRRSSPDAFHEVKLAHAAFPQQLSLAFVQNEDAVVIRDGAARFIVVPTGTGTGTAKTYTMADAQPGIAAPSASRFGRPVLAAVRTAQGYRFVWPTDRGIALFETHGDQVVPIEELNPLIASLNSVDGFARFSFVAGGDRLTLIQQANNGTQVRSWDLSAHKVQEIDRLQGDDLTTAACDFLTKPQNGSARKEQPRAMRCSVKSLAGLN